jgi:hypothetical protein
MDAAQLAQLVVTTLTPALPVLLKVGEGAVGKIGENITDAVPKLWGKLLPRLSKQTGGLQAAQSVAESPNDADLQEILKIQLKKLLQADPDFAKEIAEIVKTGQTTIQRPTVATSGDKSPGIGVANTVNIYYGDEKND